MLRKLFLFTNTLNKQQSTSTKCLIHTSSCLLEEKKQKHESSDNAFQDYEKPEKYLNLKSLSKLGLAKDHWQWPKHNRILFPPQTKDEPRRNAFVHHMRSFIHYDPVKLWYPAYLIRGMTIDEAIKQLSFHKSKGADYIKETLIEAQELAVKEHNVEYKSNLWVG